MNHLAVAQSLDDEERIVFLGDSITQSGANPNGYVTLVREALDASETNKSIEIIGAGVSGNRVPDLQKRLKQDVLDKDPTVVIVYIGINDVWHSTNGHGTPPDEFKSGLNDIIGQIKGKGARVILCTPSVIGEKHDGSNDLDEMLEQFSAISRATAKSNGVQLLDLRKEFVDHLKTANAANSESKVLTTDGVHLNAAGNKFVAGLMLNALQPGKPRTGNLRHVVLFKFNDDLGQEKIDEVVQQFADLKNKIDVIQRLEYGTDVSPENMAQGYTHCFVETFKSAADRDAYLSHDAHQEFVQFLGGKIDKVLVFDFWAD